MFWVPVVDLRSAGPDTLDHYNNLTLLLFFLMANEWVLQQVSERWIYLSNVEKRYHNESRVSLSEFGCTTGNSLCRENPCDLAELGYWYATIIISLLP